MTERSLPRPSRGVRGLAARTIFALLFSLALVVPAAAWPRRASARDLAADLSMHYIHQYLGNASDVHDCGPASVAMVLDAYRLHPGSQSNAAFVTAIRRAMGVPPTIGTVYDDLERAVSAYGLRYKLVPSSLPGEPEAELQMMRDAVDAGALVIAEVHGAVLGRGEGYGDHWVVFAGYSDDGVHLFDPDDQAARTSEWVRGGDITMSNSLFKQATLKAQPGPYGLIIYPPGRSGTLHAGGSARISGTDGDGAFLRASPGVGDNKLTVLSEGTAVTVVGSVPAANADGHDWISVSVNGQQGYVAAEYVSAASD